MKCFNQSMPYLIFSRGDCSTKILLTIFVERISTIFSYNHCQVISTPKVSQIFSHLSILKKPKILSLTRIQCINKPLLVTPHSYCYFSHGSPAHFQLNCHDPHIYILAIIKLQPNPSFNWFPFPYPPHRSQLSKSFIILDFLHLTKEKHTKMHQQK